MPHQEILYLGRSGCSLIRRRLPSCRTPYARHACSATLCSLTSNREPSVRVTFCRSTMLQLIEHHNHLQYIWSLYPSKILPSLSSLQSFL
jgi:hypothetical protein